jgi:hypothetical protein
MEEGATRMPGDRKNYRRVKIISTEHLRAEDHRKAEEFPARRRAQVF